MKHLKIIWVILIFSFIILISGCAKIRSLADDSGIWSRFSTPQQSLETLIEAINTKDEKLFNEVLAKEGEVLEDTPNFFKKGFYNNLEYTKRFRKDMLFRMSPITDYKIIFENGTIFDPSESLKGEYKKYEGYGFFVKFKSDKGNTDISPMIFLKLESGWKLLVYSLNSVVYEKDLELMDGNIAPEFVGSTLLANKAILIFNTSTVNFGKIRTVTLNTKIKNKNITSVCENISIVTEINKPIERFNFTIQAIYVAGYVNKTIIFFNCTVLPLEYLQEPRLYDVELIDDKGKTINIGIYDDITLAK